MSARLDCREEFSCKMRKQARAASFRLEVVEVTRGDKSSTRLRNAGSTSLVWTKALLEAVDKDLGSSAGSWKTSSQSRATLSASVSASSINPLMSAGGLTVYWLDIVLEDSTMSSTARLM